MNAATKNSLVWNAVPTVFKEIPNPPKLLVSTRPPAKERQLSETRPATETYQQRPCDICEGTLIIIFICCER